MALSRQVHIYSVDTRAFYTDVEVRVEELLNKTKKKASEIKKIDREERTEEQKKEYTDLNKKIKKLKDMLKSFMKKNEDIRELRDEFLKDWNIISVFESTLTRICGLESNELSMDMIVVKTFYYDVLEDLIKDGFYINDEKYISFTASAGQIRTKKTVFIKESVWIDNENSLTCGMTKERINKYGGMNVNKYLAYLALTNSATDEWVGFDIDRCIVVDDFETTFKTTVDYIDEKTYDISPKVEMDVTIPHMDGCGIVLPKLLRKSAMTRLPWVKGLIVPFQFNSFVRENLYLNPEASKIKDIYGKEYDIFEDKIEVIFTKSQFKMWKYYDSWYEYKEMFKKYNCQAGLCNEEKSFIKNANINYQMLQTLTDISDEELSILAEKTNTDISNVYTDRNTMLKLFGVTPSNTDKNDTQKIIEIYPEIMQDEHFKKTLRDIKNKLVKQGRGGKFKIDGKYTFLIPDLYAFCEWLFLDIESPKGLLKDKQVSCKLYEDGRELDVLRSPHLFMEHAVRENQINKMTKRWFITKGIYTSVHDAISRILQFDNDGDTALVCADETLVSVAKRNVENNNIVPLYYEMAKASSKELTNDEIYRGMISAYSGGNIGAISNDITKIWNSDEPNLDAIKYLCMENNFVIDYAKTLYKPTRPQHIDEMIKSFTKHKTPHFFMYAKDKTKTQVEPINKSVVNRLEYIVKDKKLKWENVALGDFDYKLMMSDTGVEIDNGIIDRYNKEKRRIMYMNSKNTLVDSRDNSYLWKHMRNMIVLDDDVNEVVDMLVVYLFANKERKRSKIAFFECFSDIIYENLLANITKPLGEYILCERCGKRVKKESKFSNISYCKKCSKEIQKEHDRAYQRRKRTKIVE